MVKLPAIGGLVYGNHSVYEYLSDSVHRFLATDKFITMMKVVGFDVANTWQ